MECFKVERNARGSFDSRQATHFYWFITTTHATGMLNISYLIDFTHTELV